MSLATAYNEALLVAADLHEKLLDARALCNAAVASRDYWVAENARLRAAIEPTAENLQALYDTWKRWDAAETVDADIGASIRMSTVLAAIRERAGRAEAGVAIETPSQKT